MTTTTAWKCEVCGYIHEGASAPSQCPICGVGADQFVPLESPSPAPVVSAPSQWRCAICDYVHDGTEAPDTCPVCGAGREHFAPEAEVERSAATPVTGPIVIIGAGVAGLTATEKARATCPDAKIVMVNREPGLPYYRLNLTRLLAGEVEEQTLCMQPEEWFAEHRIELICGDVTDIDPDGHRVTMKGGESLEYERLILASGAHAFVPPFGGVTRQGVHVLRTLADAKRILADVTPTSRCVCIGGGLLGLEAAGALARKSADVSVVEGYGWLLPRQLPETAGKMLAEHIRGLGIQIHLEAAVKELSGDESVCGVVLADGMELPADLVVISTGVRSNSHLARRAELKVKNGIVVDDAMRTSHPDIYAAGDVAEHRGVAYGIWPVAYAQGVVAGINAAGGDAEYVPVAPSNRLKVMDVDVFSIGTFTASDASFLVFEEVDTRTFTRLVVRDGCLVGAVLFGDTSNAGPIKDTVEQGTQLREAADLLEKLPSFADFLRAMG
jgi:NAD(P)H-nitrite reductase large subunit/rubredoxin